MQTRSLLISGVAFIGLLALFTSLSGPANMQDLPAGPRPTPTAAALPPDYAPSSPAGPDALPDLIVDSLLLSDPDPYVNKEVTIFVTIKNVGNKDVLPGNNFYLDFYINPPTDDLRGLRGDVYWPVQGYKMKVGQTATYSVTMSFPDTVAYNLWAQVDTPEYPCCPIGNVLESNEDNNIRGPEYVHVRTHYAWVQKDHTDFFRNMASTLDVVPVVGTVGIITNTPGLVIEGDSALTLGIFDEPPKDTWGLSSNTSDYNMINPDTQLNVGTTNDQKNVSVHAQSIAPDTELVVGVWEDGRNDPVYGRDIYLRWSKNGGTNWEGSDIEVNDVSSINDQKHPAVAVAPDGTIVVAWQDHRGSSFDIYVQVFRYISGSLRRCDANGNCATECVANCNKHVDTDANARDQILPDISVSKQGDFYIAWEDQRNGNDDIFAVRSYTSTVPCPAERRGLGFAPPRQERLPQGAAPEQTYLCWGDDTRIDDDASTTKQASPSISAVDGVKIIDILYIIVPPASPGEPPTLVVTEVVSAPTTYIVAAWEDWREGDADIYLTYSDDEGETFGVDRRLNDDKPANSTNGIGQRQPAVAITQWTKSLPFTKDTPYGPAEGQAEVPVTSMHIAWQDFRHSMNAALDDDPDIYYCRMTAQPDQYFPWAIKLVNEGQVQVNQDDERAWQTGPVWQGEPDVAAKSSAVTLAKSEGYNAFVAWADGRNYGAGDFENTDIYFRLFSNVGAPTQFIGGNNLMLNDNVRLHNFTVASYPPYRKDMPPHGHQRAPSIAATLIAEWPAIYGGYVYVGWDDDRITNPFYDRNVYLARTNMMFGGHYRAFTGPAGTPGQGQRYGSGAFISEIYDSLSTKTKWYIVDWHATTDKGTYITLQTRIGNTRAEVLASNWYPNHTSSGWPYPDDPITVGAPLEGYDAPGQHIVDAAGHTCPTNCPTARYIQYRVNFWARNASPTPVAVELYTPFLFDVILHYERFMIFLPIINKNY